LKLFEVFWLGVFELLVLVLVLSLDVLLLLLVWVSMDGWFLVFGVEGVLVDGLSGWNGVVWKGRDGMGNRGEEGGEMNTWGCAFNEEEEGECASKRQEARGEWRE
jgi:hypothetical protein